jgi:FixJ family two-component response regulator
MNLAVVDDDDDVRCALVRLFRSIGHTVVAFASAEEFEARAVPADCLIVDVRLPGLSGLELYERMRSGTTPTPVVLISGGERPDRDSLRALQPPIVTKPFDQAALMAAIAEAVSSAAAVHKHHAD